MLTCPMPEDSAGRRLADPSGLAVEERTAPWARPISTARHAHVVLALIGLLTTAKLVTAAVAPLAFDEALYWRYSRHLAAGFIDHPFLNPLMIRIGTSLFGDTTLGVRVLAILSGLIGTAAVWRAACLLLDDTRAAATAALLFNLTVTLSIGSMMATSDAAVVTTTAVLLLCVAEVDRSQWGVWWLATGVALGLGMCAKYTTAFFAFAIIAWLLATPGRRHWIISPWAWCGATLALAVFSPVVVWNAAHGWASFIYQSGRLSVAKGSAATVGEYVGAAVLLATPPVFVLGCLGMAAPRMSGLTRSGRTLLIAFVAPLWGYLLWHSLHERVQGNWLEPGYPAFAIAAAAAASGPPFRYGVLEGLRSWSVRLAVPVGLGCAGLVYLIAASGFPQLGSHDPRVRALGVGWADIGRRLEDIRREEGAHTILATDYTVASWTQFYLPSHTPVLELAERMRWVNEPPPDVGLLSAEPSLYVCKDPCPKLWKIKARFSRILRLTTLAQVSGRRVGAHYGVFRVQDRTAAPLFDTVTLRGADHEE